MPTTPEPTDIDLTSLVSQFGSEEKARTYLERLRWPDGVRCPRCDASKGISRIESRGQFDCDSCGYQFSVRVGTIFHSSHLPLWKWLLAVYVICESRQGVSANRLKEMLGVSYKTAWYLSHRIRTAMRDEAPSSLVKLMDASEPGAMIEDRDIERAGSDVRTQAARSMWSLFRRSVAGSYHHLSPKHFPAYLDETAFRYKNRENAFLFRDTVLRLLDSETLSYNDLIAGD
jgi:transposase-like protein